MRKDNKVSLLLIGPISPPIGGTTVSFGYLLKELDEFEDVSIKVIKINPTQSIPILTGALNFLTYVRIILLIPFYDVVSYQTSTSRFLKTAYFLWQYSSFFNKKIIFRLFGASFDEYFEKLISKNRLKIISVFEQAIVLIQTKGLMEYCKSLSKDIDNVFWFPTSRPVLPKVNSMNSPVDSSKLKLVFGGEVNEAKGVKLLIKLMNSFDDIDITLDVFGKCSDNQLLKELNSVNNIVYHGVVSNTDFRHALTSMDLMVFPTTWVGEGYPGVIIEAIHSGVPVITTDWKFLSELIIHNVTGYLIPINNLEKLKECVLQVYYNRDTLKLLVENTEEQAKTFDSKKWNGEYFHSLVINALHK